MWVWLGFVLLMIGTAVCLIPEFVVDLLRPPRQTRVGRVGEVAVMILVVGLCTAGAVRAARGQGPAPPAAAQADEAIPVYEEEQAGGAGGHMSVGAAHLNRPDEAGSPEAAEVADRLMHSIACLCGGCPKEAIHSCKCPYAAQERGKVLAMLRGRDVSTEAARERAFVDIRDTFVAEAGGQHVLTAPLNEGFNILAWALPYGLVLLSLIGLVAIGRRWVRRGRSERRSAATEQEPRARAEDDDYADKLDDELRDAD
jgi:cytochrome c-type biogenesis protein CcmH/NrfF